MYFGRQKAKKFSGTSAPDAPPGPCHGPSRGLIALPRPPAVFCATRVSCSYNLGTFGATMSTFFSVLTPVLSE